MSNEPADLTIAESAVAIHEMFRSYRKAGFGKWEALWLIGCMVKGVPLPDWLTDRLRNYEDDDSP